MTFRKNFNKNTNVSAIYLIILSSKFSLKQKKKKNQIKIAFIKILMILNLKTIVIFDNSTCNDTSN